MDLPLPEIHTTPLGSLGLGQKSASNMPGVIGYNEFNCHKSLLSADQIIKRWQHDRQQIAHAILAGSNTDPWVKAVSRDDHCLCKMSTEEKSFNHEGVCTGCIVLGRLFKHGEITTQVPFTIQVGAYVGTRFIARTYHRGSDIGYGLTGYTKSDYPTRVGRELLETLSNLQACDDTFLNQMYGTTFWACQGSPIQQYIVVSCFLENELNKVGFTTTPILRWVFECSGNVNVVEIQPSLGRGTLKEITAIPEYIESPRSPTARTTAVVPLTMDAARGLLMQLVSTLHFYNRYAFTHGYPSLHALGFSKQPAAYMYDDTKITSPITLHLIPSGASAVSTVSRTRIYYPGTIVEQSADLKSLPKITVAPFLGVKKTEPCAYATGSLHTFTTPCLPTYLNMRVMSYKISDVFIAYTRYLGIPLFHSSFDLYAFWLALMCEEPFYLAIQQDQVVMDIWRQLFTLEEYDMVMADIQKHRHRIDKDVSPSCEDLITLLRNYHLRCDALEHVWTALKALSK